MNKTIFTSVEKKAIEQAASKTEGVICRDVEQLIAQFGGKYIDAVVEMVLDADRIVTIGGLSNKLYKKACTNYKGASRIVRGALIHSN